MKRFYKVVSTASQAQGIVVMLDGKPVMTPGRQPLLAPTPALADAVMREWAAQGDVVDADSMPLTQLLATAIDRVMPQRDALNAQVLRYLDTDLVCYLAEGPEELAATQAAQWAPARAWFAAYCGAPLLTTTGLAALTQSAAAHAAAEKAVLAMDDYKFAAFQNVVAMAGSLVLALALVEKAHDAAQIFAAINVEEDYKAALYNEDFYGRAPHQEKREASVRRDLAAAEEFLAAL